MVEVHSAFPGDSGFSLARAGLASTVVDGKIYLLGGHNGESPVKTLEVFEPGESVDSRGVWQAMPPMLARRTYLSAATLGNKVFAIGGSADGRTLNTIEVFVPEEGAWAYWFTMPPMQTKRTLHASAVGGGRLYVCGGFDGMRDLNTVECYDHSTNAWQWKSHLSIGRSYLALAAVKGHIYAIGGQDRRLETGPRAHETVEAFDLYSERWIPMEKLATGRLGHSASVLTDEDGEEYIYVCGGSNGADVLSSVEVYKVSEGKWKEVPPMNTVRLGHTAAVFNNMLYIIGGFDGKDTIDTFEIFDFQNNRWGPLLKIGVEKQPTALEDPVAAAVVAAASAGS